MLPSWPDLLGDESLVKCHLVHLGASPRLLERKEASRGVEGGGDRRGGRGRGVALLHLFSLNHPRRVLNHI